MVSKHPRLSKPPLSEAVFEIRFSTEMAYGLFPGRLFDEVSDVFSEVEELPAASLPLDVPIPVLVRHRLKSKDGSRMLQTGHGILSVNHVSYSEYKDFRADVVRATEALARLEVVQKVQRVGLRYINQIALDRDWDSITTLTGVFPHAIGERIDSRRFQYLLAYGVDQMKLALGQVSKNGEQKVQLDIDFYREGDDVPQLGSTDLLLGWLDLAHEHVYDVFISSLEEDYLKEIT